MTENNSKNKDGWDIFSILSRASIPVAIALAGLLYNCSQQSNNRANIKAQHQRDIELSKNEAYRDEENRKADRLTRFITHLSSENPQEILIAIDVANHLLLHKQLPNEITPIIISLAKSENKDNSTAAISFAQTKGGYEDENFLIFPIRDGDDIIVPHLLINAIPGFEEKKPVYAATDINGWLVSGSIRANTEVLKLTTMKREGNNWRALGMAEKRFHPAQLINTDLPDPFRGSNIAWAKIENIYRLSEPFVDMTGSGPSLLMR